jgi:ATP-binding cassette subfamily B protein
LILRIWHELSFLSPQSRKKLLGLGLVSTITGFLDTLLIVIILQVALRLADASKPATKLPWSDTPPSSGTWLAIAAIVAIAAFVGHIAVARITPRMAAGVLGDARARALRNFVNAPWPIQSRQQEGSFQESISTLSLQSAQVATGYANSISAALSLGVLLAFAAVVNLVATVAVLFGGGMLFALMRPLTRLTRRLGTEFVHANSAFAQSVARSFSLALELRVFGVLDRAGEVLNQENARLVKQDEHSKFISRLGTTLYRDTAILLVILALVALQNVDAAAVGAFGTVVVLIIRAMSSAQALQGSMQSLNEQSPNLTILIKALESLEADPVAPGTTTIDECGTIRFERVSYAYPGAESDAIDALDLEIRPGETFGLIGPSGGGKSTLVQVLLRLRVPTGGAITVGGVGYETISPASWTRLVSLVPQEPHLMATSIRENIRFLRPWISDEEIEESARLAHVHAEIMDTPDGYATELGPSGTGLSGGQKQRVAIARAMVGEPRFLVLDEPSSALDARSDALLQETITGLGSRVTTLIIAHRASTLRVCDRIGVLVAGRITQVVDMADRPDKDEIIKTLGSQFDLSDS